MKQAILRVGGMTCPSCMTTMQTALTHVEGVEKVTVLFNAGKVKARFDETRTSARHLADTVGELGYQVTKVSVKEAQ